LFPEIPLFKIQLQIGNLPFLTAYILMLSEYEKFNKENKMTAEINAPETERKARKVIYRNASSAPVYGLGLIGALVYYIGHAVTFWAGVLGLFKAIFWPAMLVYELLKYLKM
jgi:hypothetical protein